MSNNTLARLSVELAANTAAFQQDLGKAARIAEQEMKSVADAAMKVGGLIGAGLAAGAAAFTALAKQSINAADEMGEMAQKVGMSTEALSANAYVAKMSGVETDTLTNAIKKLNVNVVDAARGQGAAKDAFAALGIELKDQNGQLKDSDTIIRELSGRMSEFEDGAVKTALATDIFGKAGADLIPMLNQGEEGFAALTKEAEQMGLILSTETANAAGEFNDSLDRMKSAIAGNVNTVVAQMLPVFNQLAGDMAKASMEGGVLTGIANGLAVAFKVMVTGGYTVAAVLEYIGNQAGMAGAALTAVLTGDFAAAKAALSDDTAAVQFGKRVEGIAALWDKTAVSAGAAAVAQEKALGAVPNYASAAGKKGKAGRTVKEKDNFDYEKSGSLFKESDERSEDEAASAAAYIERDKARVKAALESIQQGLMSRRQLEMQDFEQKRITVEQSTQYLLMNEQQKLATMEALERDHKAKLKALDDEELRQKQEQRQKMVGLVNNGLSTIASSQSKYAKVAQMAQKAQALWQVGIDTRAMMVGAYKAMVGIPVVGPALAVAASAAAFAFGAAQAAAIGGSVGGSASAGSATSAGSVASTGSIASTESKPASSRDAANTGTTIWQMPYDAIMTARQIADALDEVYASGKQPQNLRVLLT
jgi:DNA-binding phage protein